MVGGIRMYHTECTVVSNIELCRNIYEIIVESNEIAETAKPGQFLHIKTSHCKEPLLRRPISISRIYREKGLISLVYQVVGVGTEKLSGLSEGCRIDVLGPLGNGFPIFEDKSCAVIGGGMGVAPLLELAHHLRGCDAYLGFKCSPFKAEEYEKACSRVYIATEDGSTGSKGFVTDIIENIGRYDVIYTCGPKPMLMRVKEMCRSAGVECYMSVEERMGCGIGACLVCACSIEQTDGSRHYMKVCTDGPVFRAEEVVFDD